MRVPRTLALVPALAAVLVPKCPFCLAAYLIAAGCGATVAHAVAPVVFVGARVLAVAVAAALIVRLVMRVRRRAHQP